MKDYSRDTAFIRRFRAAAVEIALRKMDEVRVNLEKAGKPLVEFGPRLSSGGHFAQFFLWDTVFCAMWARHAADFPGIPLTEPLDNLYRLADDEGFINKEFTPRGVPMWNPSHPVAFAPPILSWIEEVLAREGKTGPSRWKRVYGALARHHIACRARYRRPDGLYFGDGWGCGMDDIMRHPRGMSDADAAAGGIRMTQDLICDERKGMWDWMSHLADHLSWNRQMGWIDMSCQMAFDALNLARLADRIGLAGEAEAWRGEHRELAEVINSLCWDEESGFYCDVFNGGVIRRQSAAGWWSLISRVATPERAERIIAALRDPARFNRPVPFPALAANEPDYEPETAYWRGAVWPSTNYMAICGLVEWGERDFAEDAARRYYNANAAIWEKTGTVWENLSAEQCDHVKERSGPDFCGWSAIAPVALPADFGWI